MIDTKKVVTAFVGLVTGLSLTGAAVFMPMVASAEGYTFTKLLKVGVRGTEVSNLQTVLKADSAIYPQGLVTGYFGSMTKAAVIKYQAKNGLGADGIVGAKTRAVLNNSSVVVVPPGPVVVGGGVAVSTPVQPMSSLAVRGASRIPFTKVTLTAGSSDVAINGIKVERTGLANDAVFTGIVLLDEAGIQSGNSKTFNSLHQATVGDAFILKAGTSKTYTIAGNIIADTTSYAGQVAYLSVVGIDTTGTVAGTFPITGAGHTINASLSVGTATIETGGLDPRGTATKEVNLVGYTFSSVKVNAGSAEKVKINSIRWYQSGSAAASDLSNTKTYVDGNAYDTVMSADGKYYTTVFPVGLSLEKGMSKEISIKGDIVSGSGRTVQFDIYKNTDIYLVGETYGYGITPTPVSTAGAATTGSEFLSGTPWFDGSLVNIGQGTLVVSASTAVAAGKIANGGTAQDLGAFTFDVTGESISFNNLVLSVATNTGGGGELLSGVSLYNASGAVLAGPQDTNAAGSSITFTETITLPVGKNVIKVKGNLNSNWETNATIRLSMNPATAITNITGQTSSKTITATPSATVQATQQTVAAGALTVTPSSSLINGNVINGTSGVLLARYVLDATASGEDVKVTSVQLEATQGANADIDELNSLALWDGTTALTTGSNIVSPTGHAGGTAANTVTFTLDAGGLIIPKGTSKLIDLKGNVQASTTPTAATTYRFDFNSAASSDWTVMGQSTTATIGETLSTTSTGATMTIVSSGSLTVTLDSSSPSETWLQGGSTATLGVYRFTSSNEEMAVTDLALVLPNATSSAGDITSLSLVADGVTIATKTEPAFNGGSGNAVTFQLPTSGTGSFVVAKDNYKLLTVKATFANIGVGYSGTAGNLFAVATSSVATENKALGTGSGTSANILGTAAQTNGVKYFRTVPTIAKQSGGTTLADGVQKLYKFSVTAGSNYDLALYNMNFNVATSGATASAFKLTEVETGKVVVSAIEAAGTTVTMTVASSDYGANQITVPAGATRTYELSATVTGASTNDSISTYLLGDATYPSLATNMGQAADLVTAGSNFVWSDLSDAAHGTSLTTNDWTNGYRVTSSGGYWSTGLDAQVVSK